MKPTPTPLRYPGGKGWLSYYVENFISFNKLDVDILVEPFAGSAAISISLLKKKIVDQAYISELDPLVVAFWKAVINKNSELMEHVSSMTVNLETWYYMRNYLKEELTPRSDIVELAGAFLFLNRTNYSGIVNSGPLGGKKQKSKYKIDCRFNKARILEKIESMGDLEGRMHVHQVDGLSFMKQMSLRNPDNKVFYIDPPYYRAGKILYRNYFNDEDHRRLSYFLRTLDLPWLLSYDDSEFIKGLYEEKMSSPVYTDYQSGHYKKGIMELLISNYLIPPLAPMIYVEQQNSISNSPKSLSHKIGIPE